MRVVPHTGDVDRNIVAARARRMRMSVVPHTGDVDRNCSTVQPSGRSYRSSPIRGTWIEMFSGTACACRPSVVPHTGDVDRNVLA